MIRVAALGALILAALPAGAGAASYVVEDFGDAPAGSTAAPPKSLRQIITAAAPNERVTITFARPGVVELNSLLRVPGHLRGITIDGRTATGNAAIRLVGGGTKATALDVTASGARLRNLVFQDSGLAVDGAGGNVDDVEVSGSTFLGTRASLRFARAAGAVIKDSRFEGHQATALSIGATDRSEVRGNRFLNAGGRAIAGTDVDRAQITGNEFAGAGVELGDIDRVRVAGNRFTSGAVGALVLRGETERRDAIVEDNTFTLTGSQTIRLITGVRSVVRRNTVTASGRGIVMLECYSNADGARIDFERNVLSGAQVLVNCGRPSVWDLVANRISGSHGDGVTLRAGRGRVTITGGTIAANGGTGIVVEGRTRAKISRATIASNDGAGILATGRAEVEVTRVTMGANTGPGIDVPPRGVSPGARPAAPTLRYDRKKGRINGKTCPRCRVELYESEPDPQLGNVRHGEGIRLLAVLTAGGDGRFTYPRRGSLDCPKSGRVTATATRKSGAPTSEFARDVECACVVRGKFEVDPRNVPSNGFANLGISVAFPAGATVTSVELTDVATELRPPPDAFTPLVWEEFRRPGRPLEEGFAEDFFAQFRRPPNTPGPTQPVARGSSRSPTTRPGAPSPAAPARSEIAGGHAGLHGARAS